LTCSQRSCLLWTPFALALRLGLAFVFLIAAWTKVQNMLVPGTIAEIGVPGPINFNEAIRAYQMDLPAWLESWATYAIPATEILVGTCFVLGLWTRAAALVFVLVMGAFLYGIGSVLARHLNIHCGCFGDLAFFCPADQPVGWCKVRENAGFTAGALLLLVFGPGKIALDALSCCRRVKTASAE
jgi:uncharacterized membrane protein YphA (DoxX/SURF4 family)